ncbi:MAG: MFS transporter [Spirochaetales bacterium]|nr:MFS transporter [Spirochaetales bacterium]
MKLPYVNHPRQLLRALSAGIGKSAVILPAAFATEASVGLLTLGMIFYTREVFGVPPSQVGWIAATWQACYVAGCLTMGPVGERLRPRHSLILSTGGMCLAIFGILASPAVALLFVFYGLFGLFMSLFWPPLMSWLSADFEGAPLGRMMSRLTLAGSAANVISPFVAGSLSGLSARYPLYAAAGLLAANCLFLGGAAVALPRIRTDRHLDAGRKAAEGKEDRSTPLRFPAWIGLFATFTVLGVILTVLPMHARDGLGLSKGTIGAVLLVRALSTTAGFVILGRARFWHFRLAPMSLGLGALAALVVVMTRVRAPVPLALSLGGMGPLVSLGFSGSFFHGASGSPRRAARMALHEALLAGGLIAGSAVGALVYEQFSMAMLGLGCAALLGAAIVVQLVLLRALRAAGGG